MLSGTRQLLDAALNIAAQIVEAVTGTTFWDYFQEHSPIPDELGKNPGRSFIGDAGGGGFATAPDLVRFAQALGDGTVLDRPYAELLTGAKIPEEGTQDGQPAPAYPSFMAYTMPVPIVKGQWVSGRGGANPGIAANWNIYLDTGWVGVVLANCDEAPLAELSQREIQAVTGQPASGGGGG